MEMGVLVVVVVVVVRRWNRAQRTYRLGWLKLVEFRA